MSDTKVMTPDEIYADIVSEFRRMGFAQHGSSDVPSGLKATTDLLADPDAHRFTKADAAEWEAWSDRV